MSPDVGPEPEQAKYQIGPPHICVLLWRIWTPMSPDVDVEAPKGPSEQA